MKIKHKQTSFNISNCPPVPTVPTVLLPLLLDTMDTHVVAMHTMIKSEGLTFHDCLKVCLYQIN